MGSAGSLPRLSQMPRPFSDFIPAPRMAAPGCSRVHSAALGDRLQVFSQLRLGCSSQCLISASPGFQLLADAPSAPTTCLQTSPTNLRPMCMRFPSSHEAMHVGFLLHVKPDPISGLLPPQPRELEQPPSASGARTAPPSASGARAAPLDLKSSDCSPPRPRELGQPPSASPSPRPLPVCLSPRPLPVERSLPISLGSLFPEPDGSIPTSPLAMAQPLSPFISLLHPKSCTNSTLQAPEPHRLPLASVSSSRPLAAPLGLYPSSCMEPCMSLTPLDLRLQRARLCLGLGPNPVSLRLIPLGLVRPSSSAPDHCPTLPWPRTASVSSKPDSALASVPTPSATVRTAAPSALPPNSSSARHMPLDPWSHARGLPSSYGATHVAFLLPMKPNTSPDCGSLALGLSHQQCHASEQCHASK